MSSSSCIFWKIISLILCLNVFGLLADFKSDGGLFYILGPRAFCPKVLLQNGNSNLNLDLCVIRPWLAGISQHCKLGQSKCWGGDQKPI